MRRPYLPFAVVTTATMLAAQGGAPTFVPQRHIVRAAAEDVPQLLKQLPQSRVGRLLAEPEVAAAWDAGLRRYRSQADRTAALLHAVNTRTVALEPWLVGNMATLECFDALRFPDLADLLRIELTAVVGAEAKQEPSTVVLMQCGPRAEGRWSRQFDQRAQRLQKSTLWQPVPDAKFGGFPAHVFDVRGRTPDNEPDLQDSRIWLLHLPGLFAFGGGTPEQCGTLADAPPKAEPQVLGEMNLTAFLEMFSRTGFGVPAEFTALGFADLKFLRWRWRFHGDLVLDEFEAELGDEPAGLIGALLTATTKPPAQPLPDGALAQLRAGFDLKLLLKTLRDVSGGEALPEPVEKLVGAAFTGGVALGINAPAPGGMIPRLYLSLGIADDKALDELLAMLVAPPAKGGHEHADRPAGIGSKKVTYEGTECTVLTIPDMPSALQPTFCRIDGVLHVAESGLSMRAFLKARAKGGDAMDVGDAPLPPGPGEVLPNFDVRCDEQALYRTFHKVWLPLFKLIPGGVELQPLVAENEMPSPDVVLPHLGRSRGVLRKDGRTWRLQQLGPLGGVETAAMAMTWGPFLSSNFHRDWAAEQLLRSVAQAQLEAVWPALEAFEQANKRWPKDLGELFVAGKLADDALLLPGDSEAEAVALPAGDARTIRSSFRYFATPVTVQDGNDTKALLIAVRPQRYGRPVLTTTGAMPQLWGEDSQKPIDQFGK